MFRIAALVVVLSNLCVQCLVAADESVLLTDQPNQVALPPEPERLPLPEPSDTPNVGQPFRNVESASPTPNSMSLAELGVTTPAVRDVQLNLSIDDLQTDTVVQLKRKRSGVIAESLKILPEKLEYEVTIHWPCGEIPVYFPVPDGSAVCAAYHDYKDTEPSKILEAMCDVRRPIVRVVGIRTVQPFKVYQGGCLAKCQASCYWKPFYEVFLPDAECSEPVLVPIPMADHILHDAVKSAANNLLAPQQMVVVAQLSGGETSCVQCCRSCENKAPCGSSHVARSDCGCTR
jgi:hypothetical protein